MYKTIVNDFELKLYINFKKYIKRKLRVGEVLNSFLEVLIKYMCYTIADEITNNCKSVTNRHH